MGGEWGYEGEFVLVLGFWDYFELEKKIVVFDMLKDVLWVVIGLDLFED